MVYSVQFVVHPVATRGQYNKYSQVHSQTLPIVYQAAVIFIVSFIILECRAAFQAFLLRSKVVTNRK